MTRHETPPSGPESSRDDEGQGWAYPQGSTGRDDERAAEAHAWHVEGSRQPQPWHQQSGETDKAYRAFLVYRDLPPRDRSRQRAASELYGKGEPFNPRKPAPGKITLWMHQHHWRERASAWDAERRAREALQLRTVVMQPVIALLRQIRADAERVREERALDPSTPDVTLLEQLPTGKLADLALRAAQVWPRIVQAEQLLAGEPTHHLTVRHAPQAPVSPVQTDAAYAEAVYAKLAEAGKLPPMESVEGEDETDDDTPAA